MINKIGFNGLRLGNLSTRANLADIMGQSKDNKEIVAKQLEELDTASKNDIVILSLQSAHDENGTNGHRLIVNDKCGKVISKCFLAENVTPYHIERKFDQLIQGVKKETKKNPEDDIDEILDCYM